MENSQLVEHASELAKRWMHGARQGSGRAAWEHPQDLVRTLRNLHEQVSRAIHCESCLSEGHFSPCDECLAEQKLLDRDYDHAQAVAWLHDVIEDGRTSSEGKRVTREDLSDNKMSDRVVAEIVHLSQRPDESKIEYLTRFLKGVRTHAIPPSAALVKIVDRVCNLREGAGVFKYERWTRVVGETREFIYPLLEFVSRHEKEILEKYLDSAIEKGNAHYAATSE